MMWKDPYQSPNLEQLDATMGQRWMQKELSITNGFTEIDILEEKRPHVKASYTHLPFQTNQFNLVLFDPPFASGGDTEPLAQFWFHFGRTGPIQPFRKSMFLAFRELSRVLKPKGRLIFKWGTSWKPLAWIMQYVPHDLVEIRRYSRKGRGGNSTAWFVVFAKAEVSQSHTRETSR